MSNPSNLYAEKIFSEHPISLWALDEQLDYINLIQESQRDITNSWSITNGSVISGSGLLNKPFPSSYTSTIVGDVPVTAYQTISAVSPDIINLTSLNQGLQTFAIGAYFYIDTTYTIAVSIGYEYTDPDTLDVVQNIKKFTTSAYNTWAHVSETFDLPNVNAQLRIVLQSEVVSGGTSGQYNISFNGITLGQWNEEFNATSLGITSTTLPTNISLPSSQVIEANTYSIGSDPGYYFVNNNGLVAQNTSIPLVYGASGLTRLIPNDTNPSLIIPGKGFLNQDGQYNEYTVEFWLRLESDSVTPKRIFGPIASSDGLYVQNDSIALVIGDQFASHSVGEWYRPMLIDIIVIKNSALVLINGEQVISLTIDTGSLVLPNSVDIDGKEQDWLGFYAYDDIKPVEVDCIAIYSYKVPIAVAKRRWVYGQGVLSPEGINAAYGGTSAFIDYPFAKYTANYSYPNFAQWQQGTFDNLVTTGTTLRTPEYSLPEIYLESKTLNDLYADCRAIQSGPDKFITFRPNPTWENIPAYINFSKFNILNDQIHVIYAIVQINDDDLTEQTIIKIYNTLTGNSFIIKKDGAQIHYYLNYNGALQEFYTTENFVVGDKIAVGVDVEELVAIFGGDIAAFFGNQNGLKMYVGGDETGTETFTGYLYSFGISTNFNETEIESHFLSNGIAKLDAGEDLLAHTASYTLLPTEAYDTFFLDIGVSGHWEDYMPLSYFGQYIKNSSGLDYYDLDFLQFNIGYPSPSKFTNENTYPYYDVSNLDLKSYVTFQYVANGANLIDSNFIYTEPVNKEKIIKIDEYPNWQETKFEILDNTIIYPPKTVDFNELAIVYHVKFNSRHAISKPVMLKRLEISSQAFNENSFNSVGTRYGVDLFPYKKSGFYYDYKSKNPFSIYKGSTPYLYLTRTSGIEVRDSFDTFIDRGLSIPVNQTLSADFKISAGQAWIRYDKDLFPETPTKFLEIDYKDTKITLYVVANSSDRSRGKIYSIHGDLDINYSGMSFYINGNLVREPVITAKQWSAIGFSFGTSLSFDSYLGAIRLTGPFVYNNVSFYQSTSLREIQQQTQRNWFRVLTPDGVNHYDWQYWVNNYSWDGVLVLGSTEFYGINPGDIYKSYIGTNKIIFDDSEGMTFSDDKVKLYSSLSWQDNIITPV